ncbi:hypothetical protein B0H16DRAFT_1541471 [Mycena metata]|uniref:Uncharacterized protein n=1 Tax=Mycena metata TaxID=1033252 RepID=A0AAD7J3T7_9AGAR|nr:hypothetical protein B0H16DRAFT_1541471 [Mycena metata]
MSGNPAAPQSRPDFSGLSDPVAIEALFDALDLGAFFLEFESRTTSSGTGPFSRLIHPMIVAGITEDNLSRRIENYLHTTHANNLPVTFHVVIREADDQFEVLLFRGNDGGVGVHWIQGNRARAAMAPLPSDIPRGLPTPGPTSPNVASEMLRFWEDVLRGLDFTAYFNSTWGQSPSATINITNPAHEDEALARINGALAAVQRGALLPPNETIYPVSIQRADGTPFFRPTDWDVPLLETAAVPGAAVNQSPRSVPVAVVNNSPRSSLSHTMVSVSPRPEGRSGSNAGSGLGDGRDGLMPPAPNIPSFMPRPNPRNSGRRPNILPKPNFGFTNGPTAGHPPPAMHQWSPVFPNQPPRPPLAPWPSTTRLTRLPNQFLVPQVPVMPQFRTVQVPFLPAHEWGTLYGPVRPWQVPRRTPYASPPTPYRFSVY